MQKSFSVIRLNVHSDSSWAVIEMPSGRIVTDASGNLFMRMTKAEATSLAGTLAEGPPFVQVGALAKPANRLPA